MSKLRSIIIVFIFLCLYSISASAEMLQPVVWQTEERNDSIYVSAVIEDGWHMTLISLNGEETGKEYEGSFLLALSKKEAAGGVEIRYNACDDTQCTAPETFIVPASDMRVADDKDVVPTDNGYGDLWHIFLLGLLAGLLAVFTPCVWPVIPMTVSFFLKKGGGVRDALVYGMSIIILYVGLGVAVTAVFGASALNSLSTNAWLNLFFFVVFVLFALSFFGLFELNLPASWSNRLDSQARKSSGFISIVFMAFTLAVVSFSCTGPLIGTLLVEAADMSLYAPAIGMFGFAVALALPFSLFALFPGWLQSMPRSGNWMDAFKVSLAFIELALSLKFLSVADMAYGWGILPRNLFIILWAICFAALALYLIWHSKRIEGSRKLVRKVIVFILAAASFGFAVYMLTGLAGGKMKAVSAFLPPQELEGNVFTNLRPALDKAKLTGKPLLIQFSGYGCVNCRKMEVAVLEDDYVKDVLNDYIQVVLYVDSRQDENNNGIEDGEEWAELQKELIRQNSQPCFVQLNRLQVDELIHTLDNNMPVQRLTNSNGSYLTTIGYTEDTNIFIEYLRLSNN